MQLSRVYPARVVRVPRVERGPRTLINCQRRPPAHYRAEAADVDQHGPASLWPPLTSTEDGEDL